MEVSVIIPVINEETNLRRLLPVLVASNPKEIIMVDGGSVDQSKAVASSFGATIVDSPKGRPQQMNRGAAVASGAIYYFVHADSIPPKSCIRDIQANVSEQVQFGCFRSLFDTDSLFLRINSYFSRFKGMMFRGGGQTLWVTQSLFDQLNGYDESLKLMEEYDFIKRAKQLSDYNVIQKDVLVSTRTYDENGNFKTQLVYALVMFGFFRGIDQDKLIQFAKYWLN